MTELSKNEKEYLIDLLKTGARFDGRGLLDHRNITINFGYKLGAVELALGQTKVFTTVDAKLEEPKSDRPNEGFLQFDIDLSIMENEKQSSSIYDPKKYANEIARIIERIIKGSKAIDVESLCLISMKSVWSITVNCTLLNNDGNIIDACYLAIIVALMHYKKPYANVVDQTKVVLNHNNLQPLSIHHLPIAITYSFFYNSEIVVMDPTKIEEEVQDGRLTLAVNIYRDICLIHKPGSAGLSASLFDKLFDVCLIKVQHLTKIIRDVIRNTDKHSMELLRESCKVEFVKSIESGSEIESQIASLIIKNNNKQELIDEEFNEDELKSTLKVNK